MTQAHSFSDEDLTAYLDGEADSTLEAAISAALETDEALQARLARLDVPLATIAQAYDSVLAQAPAMPDTATVRPMLRDTHRRWAWGAATFGTGLVAGLALAVLWGVSTSQPEARGWVSHVASYQKLYTATTFAAVSATPQQVDQQLAEVSQGIGIDLINLPQAAGLTFKRAQLLGFAGKPLVQISYLRDDGTPVALCIIPAGPDDAGLSMGAAEGLGLARWNTHGYGFLLIGGDEAAPLAREAEIFRDWSVDIPA